MIQLIELLSYNLFNLSSVGEQSSHAFINNAEMQVNLHAALDATCEGPKIYVMFCQLVLSGIGRTELKPLAAGRFLVIFYVYQDNFFFKNIAAM